jgi:SAM-dependent methyltransferase
VDESLRTSALHARDAVAAGRLRGQTLLDALLAVRFDERDLWLDQLLALPGLPADLPDLSPGTVPYLPCDVDAIVRAVREAPVTTADVFVDLGAGLGRPALLAHLLSGARAVGVELQPHLVDHARTATARLGLDTVQFFVADAASGDIPDGTVYFIYASFNGAALARVLDRLQRIAAQSRIVLCAVGFDVRESWLIERRSTSPELVFYDSACRHASCLRVPRGRNG